MSETASASAASPGIDGFLELPAIARVEADRYCDHCGYNLRGQSVRRDPRTGVLLATCPECGHYHAAGDQTLARHVWLRRFGVCLLGWWVISLVAGYIALYGIMAAICFSTIDYVRWNQRHNAYPGYYDSNVRDELTQILIASTLGAAAIGAVTTLAAVIFFPHWRRWGYHVLAAVGPVLTACFIVSIIAVFSPRDYHVAETAMVFIAIELFTCFASATAAAIFGRWIARGVVRLLVPPRFRPMLAYLWTADGKAPPSVKA